jgi:hypothetical protein
MASKLGKQRESQNQSEPRYGDIFIVTGQQLYGALVTASERQYELSFSDPECCVVYMDALYEMHRIFARVFNDESKFEEGDDFYLIPAFVEYAKDGSAVIAISELSSRLSIAADDLVSLWENSLPLRERVKAMTEKLKRANPKSRKLVKLDLGVLKPAICN